MLGDKDVAKTKKLLTEATVEKMPFEALGWVLSVLANDPNSKAETDAIIRHLMNRTAETPATANFVTNYGDGAWLIMYSNRRADGVLLEAMIKADPKNDLIPKLVRGLLAHRTKGAWSNTQEKAAGLRDTAVAGPPGPAGRTGHGRVVRCQRRARRDQVTRAALTGTQP